MGDSGQKSKSLEKLSRRMSSLIMVVALVPLMIVTGIVVERYNTAYRAKTRAHLEELVQKHARMVDAFLLERLRTISLLAHVCSCEELADPIFLHTRLMDLRKEYGPVFQDMGFVNDRGRQVAYAGKYQLHNANYSGADWFKKAFAAKQFISDAFSGLRGFPHCIVTVTKKGRDRRWILRATIDFSVFSSIVETLRIGQTGYAFIVNEKGEFQTQRPGAYTGSRVYRLDTYRRNNDYLEITAALKSGDWHLVVIQERADAYAEILKTNKVAFGIFFFGLVASVVTAICVPIYILTRMKAKR